MNENNMNFMARRLSAVVLRIANITKWYWERFLCAGSTVSSQISKNMRPKVKKILKLAKGYRGRSKNTFRAAIRRVEKAQTNMYKGRKMQKRNIRRQWIVGVNAGVRQYGMSYSNFINEASKANIELNRKVLSDIAANEPYSFRSIIEVIKSPSVIKEPQVTAGEST